MSGTVGNRDGRYALGVQAMWDPHEPDGHRFPEWVRGGWERLRPFSTGRTYINFQTADEDEERIRATYGSNFDRLAEIKQTYDPEQPVPIATATSGLGATRMSAIKTRLLAVGVVAPASSERTRRAPSSPPTRSTGTRPTSRAAG